MTSRSARTPSEFVREDAWATVRTLIRELEETRDLKGLAAVAEMAMVGLRQMCERPVTCEELAEIIERLRGLKLDEFEQGLDG